MFVQTINELSARLGPMCIIIIDTVSALVTRLSVSSLIGHLMEKLASPLASLFTAATKRTPAKLCLPAFSQKVTPEAELTCLFAFEQGMALPRSLLSVDSRVQTSY